MSSSVCGVLRKFWLAAAFGRESFRHAGDLLGNAAAAGEVAEFFGAQVVEKSEYVGERRFGVADQVDHDVVVACPVSVESDVADDAFGEAFVGGEFACIGGLESRRADGCHVNEFVGISDEDVDGFFAAHGCESDFLGNAHLSDLAVEISGDSGGFFFIEVVVVCVGAFAFCAGQILQCGKSRFLALNFGGFGAQDGCELVVVEEAFGDVLVGFVQGFDGGDIGDFNVVLAGECDEFVDGCHACVDVFVELLDDFGGSQNADLVAGDEVAEVGRCVLGEVDDGVVVDVFVQDDGVAHSVDGALGG